MSRFSYMPAFDDNDTPGAIADEVFPTDCKRRGKAERDIVRARQEARDKEREIKRAWSW